jgi:hypothetical protein
MTVPLPGRTLRIGVTGTRTLDEADRPHVRDQVTALLDQIACTRCPDGIPPHLQLLSPLAEGADRLVAQCALDAGYELACPLPFPQSIYEDDFKTTPGSLAEFRTLLARAEGRVLALDGARDDPARALYAEARSYEAVGRLVVRNCDLLIGIWDGAPGKGRGGTADTIRHAALSGPPVVWIDATAAAAPPRWIADLHDLRHNALPSDVETHLDAYLRRLLHPPAPPRHAGGHGGLHRLGLGLRIIADILPRNRPPPTSPVEAFLRQQPKPDRRIWRAHGWLMRIMSGGLNPPWTKPHRPADAIAQCWFDRYQPADAHAAAYARRYRSSYVWVFALGAVALSAAAVSLGFGGHPTAKLLATIAEALVLVLIATLVIADGAQGWHRRAIADRLVAELCRKQQALAPLGWVVPRAAAWAKSPHDQGANAWVSWLFSAWLRDTPLPAETIDRDRVTTVRDTALADLLAEQIDYHTTRQAQAHKAARRLEFLGELAFGLVLAVVLAKLVLLTGGEATEALHGWLLPLGLAGAILPAASAAFVGIRAYAELDMLAEQSETMLAALHRSQARIRDLDADAPLASQALGNALASVATLMLEDLDGWTRLFRGKVLDA